MKKIFGALKKIFGAAMIALIAFSVIGAVFVSVFKKANDKPLFLFGKTLMWVETASMEPAIEARSFILADKYDGKTLKVNDVITFICRNENSEVYGRLITHRIVEVTESGYKTKGDNILSAVDDRTVTSGDVVAVYRKNLKALTFAGRVFASPAGLILIISAFLFSCAFVYIPDMINVLKSEDGVKTEKEKEIERRVKEEVEKLMKENGSDEK